MPDGDNPYHSSVVEDESSQNPISRLWLRSSRWTSYAAGALSVAGLMLSPKGSHWSTQKHLAATVQISGGLVALLAIVLCCISYFICTPSQLDRYPIGNAIGFIALAVLINFFVIPA